MTEVLVTSEEKVPIFPLLADAPVVPDAAAVVPFNTTATSVGDDQFGALTDLAGQPAVWVRGLAPGTYVVVCRMDLQSDGQHPVWPLKGTIEIASRITA